MRSEDGGVLRRGFSYVILQETVYKPHEKRRKEKIWSRNLRKRRMQNLVKFPPKTFYRHTILFFNLEGNIISRQDLPFNDSRCKSKAFSLQWSFYNILITFLLTVYWTYVNMLEENKCLLLWDLINNISFPSQSVHLSLAIFSYKWRPNLGRQRRLSSHCYNERLDRLASSRAC